MRAGGRVREARRGEAKFAAAVSSAAGDADAGGGLAVQERRRLSLDIGTHRMRARDAHLWLRCKRPNRCARLGTLPLLIAHGYPSAAAGRDSRAFTPRLRGMS